MAAEGKVGFIGLGIMGEGMAANLVKSGRDVVVWNRTTVKSHEFAKRHGERVSVVETPKAVVESCSITYACLTTPEVALEVHMHEESGSILGLGEGKALVECSTLDAATNIKINSAVLERGARFLEAPVSGSKGPAADGTLIFLCGGNEELFDQVKENDLKAMGKASFFLGDVGKGSEMKLVVNMIMGGMMSCLVEGTSVAHAAGLDLGSLSEVLNLGALGSPMVKGKLPKIIEGNYDPNFPLKHQQKDLRLALELGDSHSLRLPVTTAANDLHKLAIEKGHGDKDFSAVFEAAKKEEK
eukprot:CAMPEP_0201489890 /NCGR_PEP_ID=MMETSP0151_2-20130828/24066_1 /ASSEMBLY_ACC=CAM_ASM_000257 /TAXON_ID=200890 /ORGANISM="Paramoeba atlantica, Strain 621/1 / CCAP 1560/9" /LENGTH=298 /DNA_ID=CAMNT_0047875621 /DNA_START=272 /DNA_END=1168 /DNA_ORIENTATION=-